MKKAFIVHGWGGSPEEPLHQWLKLELGKRGFEVTIPQMPNSQAPVIGDWALKLNETIKESGRETLLIGHSIGCQAILRHLEKLNPGVKVGKVILIAPWFTLTNLETKEEWEIARPWLETEIRETDVLKHTLEIVAIFSDNDPYVSLDNAELFKKRFGAKIILEKNKGHFTEDDGVREITSVLEIMDLAGA